MKTLPSLILALGICGFLSGRAEAQFKKETTKGARLGEAKTSQYQAGMIVSSGGAPCRGLVGTLPIPTDWPEQEVKVVKEEISPGAQVNYRELDKAIKQMLVSVPFLPAGQESRVLVTYEIKRFAQLAPEKTDLFVVPDKISADVRVFLNPSPGIESRSEKIKSLSREILKDKTTAWSKVEALYDWTREHIKYKHCPFKGAMEALKDGNGDVEEISSLFIALCRASNIPARTVWVPGHCYPEFYLEDDEGKGHWIPCQAAGERAFGSIPEQRPILQKGDNFRVPEKPRSMERFVAEHLTGKGGKPSVKFVRETVDGAAKP